MKTKQATLTTTGSSTKLDYLQYLLLKGGPDRHEYEALDELINGLYERKLNNEVSDLEIEEFKSLFDHEAKLASYGGPTLVLHAEQDHLVGVEHARQNASWAGPETRLVILPKGDHNSVFYENRERYLAELGSFFELCAC